MFKIFDELSPDNFRASVTANTDRQASISFCCGSRSWIHHDRKMDPDPFKIYWFIKQMTHYQTCFFFFAKTYWTIPRYGKKVNMENRVLQIQRIRILSTESSSRFLNREPATVKKYDNTFFARTQINELCKLYITWQHDIRLQAAEQLLYYHPSHPTRQQT